MPLQQCTIDSKRGWRWGRRGKCYPGPIGKQQAIKQAIAMGEIPTHNTKPNPLRSDPTRTATLRRQFQAEITRRIRELKRSIFKLIVEDDALGLKRPPNPFLLSHNVLTNPFLPSQSILNQRWLFRTSADQLSQFQLWMQSQTQSKILGGIKPDLASEGYWKRYVEAGYRKGAGRAFDDARKAGLYSSQEQLAWYKGTKDEFLRSAFGRPVSINKVKLLSSRVFTDLKGVSDAMGTQLTRTLADGLTAGKGPRAVASDLFRSVEGITRTRAKVIARTELIRAHAEGQLDTLEELGVTELGVMVEWNTTGDFNVCPLCQPLDGVVIKIGKAHGMLPRHPNCRCAWIPANVGEPPTGQKRGKRADKSLKRSVAEEGGKRRTAEEAVKDSSWVGADRIGTQAVKPLKSIVRPLSREPRVVKRIRQRIAPLSPVGRSELQKLIVRRAGISKRIKQGISTPAEEAELAKIRLRIKELKTAAPTPIPKPTSKLPVPPTLRPTAPIRPKPVTVSKPKPKLIPKKTHPKLAVEKVDRKRVEGAIRTAEKDIQGRNKERLYILDKKGNTVSIVDGTSNAVTLSKETRRQMKGRITLHNHPNQHGGSTSFSGADIQGAIQRGEYESRVIGQDGAKFWMNYGTKVDKMTGLDRMVFGRRVSRSYNSELKRQASDFAKKVKSGEISPHRAALELSDDAWKTTARKHGIGYRSELPQA